MFSSASGRRQGCRCRGRRPLNLPSLTAVLRPAARARRGRLTLDLRTVPVPAQARGHRDADAWQVATSS
eukprot:6876999-Heterocapsa_arctica.AAC.1